MPSSCGTQLSDRNLSSQPTLSAQTTNNAATERAEELPRTLPVVPSLARAWNSAVCAAGDSGAIDSNACSAVVGMGCDRRYFAVQRCVGRTNDLIRRWNQYRLAAGASGRASGTGVLEINT